ncbi:MAG: ATP-binding cassette domain-containing protein [Gammaproteobacteria bacterium]|nr:ATP-binding cassette domain-containing protein [Gammaproteobacteria bacterium]
MNPPLLQVDQLRVHFPIETGGFLRRTYTPLKAVDGVSFELQAGEALGVVGESGCGKSTLGRAILRFVHMTQGRVVWMGQDLAGLNKSQMKGLRREMQIVFQDPLSSHNPRMTVGSIIGEPLTVFKPEIGKAARETEVQAVMRDVGLSPEIANRYPHELSGGQCQRVGIARAMILKPKLVICDEPVSALDVSTQAQVINVLRRLQREHGVALIFISHDLSVVRHLCQRILVMYLGHLMEIGTRDQMFDQPRHPYTQALINAVPIPDPRLQRAKPRVVVTGDLPSPLEPPSGCVFRTRCPYASQVCIKRIPELEVVADGQKVACHHWRENKSLVFGTT